MADTEIPTVTVREWTDLVRRARLGRTVKAVALMMATYADYRTGRRVRPGLARLAFAVELHYSSTKKAVAELRRVGLILLVKRATSFGDADEYRLIIGPDVLDHLDVPTPAVEELEVERIRGTQRKRPQAGASPVRKRKPRAGRSPVRDGAQAAPPPVREPDPADSTGDAAARSSVCTGGGDGDAQAAAPPGINQDHPQPLTNSLDVGRNHQTARDDAAEDSSSTGEGERLTEPTEPTEHAAPKPPEKCSHGLPVRRRRDGQPECVFCRREAGYKPPPPPGAVPRTTRPALALVKPA